MMKLRKRGQNTAEYAILIALVIAAAVGMQLYVKRGLQARAKGGVEYLAAQTNAIDSANYRTQYEPYYQDQSFNVTQEQQSAVTIGTGQTVTGTVNAATSRAVGGYQQQLFNATQGNE